LAHRSLYQASKILRCYFALVRSVLWPLLPPLRIDRPSQPFNYFSKTAGEIGMMDAEAATEVTPEGHLRTGFGELMFFQ